MMGVDSLNLSPDVYDSHRYTTVARAVEESKRWVCSNSFVIVAAAAPIHPFHLFSFPAIQLQRLQQISWSPGFLINPPKQTVIP